MFYIEFQMNVIDQARENGLEISVDNLGSLFLKTYPCNDKENGYQVVIEKDKFLKLLAQLLNLEIKDKTYPTYY